MASLKQIFTDVNGKLSAKRSWFPVCLAITVLLIILQGTGYFEYNVNSLLQTMIISTFALLGLSVGERIKS